MRNHRTYSFFFVRWMVFCRFTTFFSLSIPLYYVKFGFNYAWIFSKLHRHSFLTRQVWIMRWWNAFMFWVIVLLFPTFTIYSFADRHLISPYYASLPGVLGIVTGLILLLHLFSSLLYPRFRHSIPVLRRVFSLVMVVFWELGAKHGSLLDFIRRLGIHFLLLVATVAGIVLFVQCRSILFQK